MTSPVSNTLTTNKASEQTLIREEMNTLASQVSSDIAYADLQNAYANIFASMGIDPYANDLKASDNIDGLAHTLQQVWIERGDRSGTVRAKSSAVDHVVTGSIKKPAKKLATDPFVTETIGWKGLKEDQEKKQQYNTQIVHVQNKKQTDFLSSLLRGGETGQKLIKKPSDR